MLIIKKMKGETTEGIKKALETFGKKKITSWNIGIQTDMKEKVNKRVS